MQSPFGRIEESVSMQNRPKSDLAWSFVNAEYHGDSPPLIWEYSIIQVKFLLLFYLDSGDCFDLMSLGHAFPGR